MFVHDGPSQVVLTTKVSKKGLILVFLKLFSHQALSFQLKEGE